MHSDDEPGDSSAASIAVAPTREQAARARGAPLLGLDPGARWIGVAVSDPEWRVASPMTRFARESAPRDAERIAELARERGARGVVVGWAISMSGRQGRRAHAARALADAVSARGLACFLQDERWSTRAVERAMPGMGRRERDLAAAAWILQTFLERMRGLERRRGLG